MYSGFTLPNDSFDQTICIWFNGNYLAKESSSHIYMQVKWQWMSKYGLCESKSKTTLGYIAECWMLIQKQTHKIDRWWVWSCVYVCHVCEISEQMVSHNNHQLKHMFWNQCGDQITPTKKMGSNIENQVELNWKYSLYIGISFSTYVLSPSQSTN